jgi:hypothetical protein
LLLADQSRYGAGRVLNHAEKTAAHHPRSVNQLATQFNASPSALVNVLHRDVDQPSGRNLDIGSACVAYTGNWFFSTGSEDIEIVIISHIVWLGPPANHLAIKFPDDIRILYRKISPHDRTNFCVLLALIDKLLVSFSCEQIRVCQTNGFSDYRYFYRAPLQTRHERKTAGQRSRLATRKQ